MKPPRKKKGLRCLLTDYSAQLVAPVTRIVLFAQQSTARDGEGVVRRLAESLQGPTDHVIFTTYYKDKSTSSEPGKMDRANI